MSFKKRGEILEPEDKCELTIQFTGPDGLPINCDSYPSISIVQPDGLVMMSPTSVGVTQLDIGKYGYLFEVPINGPFGVFNDEWNGFINSFRVQETFSFIVNYTQTPQINQEGIVALGDDPGFHYSQEALMNINKLLKSLRARLSNDGKAKSFDSFGNVQYISCSIFSVDMLTTFLDTSLMDFNQIPFFTGFTWENSPAIAQFGEIIIEGATLQALASKALLERGREMVINDQGISFTPPSVSELMMTQYSALLSHYWEKVKLVKNSLRPIGIGLGIMGMNSGINPAISRMRHLRERRVI